MTIRPVKEIDDLVPVQTILASVFDKKGLADLARGILAVNPNAHFLSTGGTYRDCLKPAIGKKENLAEVSVYTRQPKIEGGLVKTLDWKIFFGLLAETYCDAHQKDMAIFSVFPIDLVLANLYPFEETIAKPDANPENARGNIDIGGPSMIRAAAKNFHRVAVVVDPEDYPLVLEVLRRNNGFLPLKLRLHLAKKAFVHVTNYDLAIAGYFNTATLEEFTTCYKIHKSSRNLSGRTRDF